jgi:hypothetical protein
VTYSSFSEGQEAPSVPCETPPSSSDTKTPEIAPPTWPLMNNQGENWCSPCTEIITDRKRSLRSGTKRNWSHIVADDTTTDDMEEPNSKNLIPLFDNPFRNLQGISLTNDDYYSPTISKEQLKAENVLLEERIKGLEGGRTQELDTVMTERCDN